MAAPSSFTRTRIAPTPSGFLHLGNAASFLLTAALARRTGARLLLRIDDMDRERVRPAYLQDVFDTLRFLEIDWQEGPRDALDFEQAWSQRHRLPQYLAALQQLREQGVVFACTCSRADILKSSADGTYPGTCLHKNLPLDTPGAAWRLDTSTAAPLRVQSLTGVREVPGLPPSVRHFMVRKKDGLPAYQLSSLVDDVYYGVDLVVRGADLWDSTLAQLYLSRVLGLDAFSDCTFVHHGLVPGEDGSKLSKSAGATSVREIRAGGATLVDIRDRVREFLNDQSI
ncbi:glutamate--tRNA ligase family protein [Flaviaesturariibacter amylovorans]|uniref:tRNA glutamyl-Q(34) synthetase GluQRS n=1 Tax=Flaviaesturariibacter amylovorans TaxID=1084520 RepID=A0ABP8G733_9BACT